MFIFSQKARYKNKLRDLIVDQVTKDKEGKRVVSRPSSSSHFLGKDDIEVHVRHIIVCFRAFDALVLAHRLVVPGQEPVSGDDELSGLIPAGIIVTPKVESGDVGLCVMSPGDIEAERHQDALLEVLDGRILPLVCPRDVEANISVCGQLVVHKGPAIAGVANVLEGGGQDPRLSALGQRLFKGVDNVPPVHPGEGRLDPVARVVGCGNKRGPGLEDIAGGCRTLDDLVPASFDVIVQVLSGKGLCAGRKGARKEVECVEGLHNLFSGDRIRNVHHCRVPAGGAPTGVLDKRLARGAHCVPVVAVLPLWVLRHGQLEADGTL